jgi:peptidoglycan/LPS O-acetylase OafA/YrhL
MVQGLAGRQKSRDKHMGSLRTLFAIAVVFAHSPWNDGNSFVGGQNAVQLFYMISGFLISYIIATNPAYRTPARFYLNRALRIYPIYYVVAILTVIARLVGDPKFFDFYEKIPPAATALLEFSNVFLFGQDAVMFAGVDHDQLVFAPDFRQSEHLLFTGLLVPQAWTLGVELSFYALAPFILRNKATLLLILTASLATRVALIWIGPGSHDPWTYRFFPAELSLFILGSLSCHYLLPRWKGYLASADSQDRLPKMATYFLIVLSVFYFAIPGDEHIKRLSLFAVFLVLLPLAFIYQNTSRIDSAIGELSYPIYIGHMLVIMAFGVLTSKHGITSVVVITLGNVVLAVGFAYVLNILVSGRVERVRQAIGSLKQ